MTFRNSILAGLTLIREAIRSQNYSAGVSGWSIDADGSAEFNDITIRDGTVISGSAFYYNPAPGPGNLILSIAAEPGTDEYGNAYPAGITWFDSAGTLNGSGTRLALTASNGSVVEVTAQGQFGNGLYLSPPVSSDGTWVPGAIAADYSSNAPDSPYLSIYSPYDSIAGNAASIVLTGEDSASGPTAVDMDADTVNVHADMTIDGQITSYDGNTFPAYVPSISGGGAATFSTIDGWYQRLGKMIYVYVYFVVGTAGSGATNVQITLPVAPWRGSTNRRQSVPGAVRDGGVVAPGPLAGIVFAGGAGATINRVVDSSGADVKGAALTAGSIWTFEGWYREA